MTMPSRGLVAFVVGCYIGLISTPLAGAASSRMQLTWVDRAATAPTQLFVRCNSQNRHSARSSQPRAVIPFEMERNADRFEGKGE